MLLYFTLFQNPCYTLMLPMKQISLLSQDSKMHLHLAFFLKSLCSILMKILLKRILSDKTLFYCYHKVIICDNVFQ